MNCPTVRKGKEKRRENPRECYKCIKFGEKTGKDDKQKSEEYTEGSITEFSISNVPVLLSFSSCPLQRSALYQLFMYSPFVASLEYRVRVKK